jgi:hypothetical protein
LHGGADGDQLTYNWSFVSRPEGSTAMLSDPSAVNPAFGVDRPGTYVVQLVVNDGFVNSAPATVMVSTSNSPPAAEAGPNQTPYVNNVVRLDGRASSDPDHDTLTFSWSITTRPEGSAATLSDPSSPTPSFFADRTGAYVAQLIVNDGSSDSEPDTVMIEVAARGRFTLSALRLVTRSSGTMTVILDAPAGASGLEVNLSLDNAPLALVPETVTIAGGGQSADFVVTSSTIAGSATVTAFAPDYANGAGTLTVDNRQWSLALADPLVGVGPERSTTGGRHGQYHEQRRDYRDRLSSRRADGCAARRQHQHRNSRGRYDCRFQGNGTRAGSGGLHRRGRRVCAGVNRGQGHRLGFRTCPE